MSLDTESPVKVNGHPQPVKLDKAVPQTRQPLEGTIVTTGAEQQLRATKLNVPRPPGRVRRGARAVRVVVTHERTRNGARLVARHGLYTASGALVVARRTWESRTTARFERMMRSAEAVGQHEQALEWEVRAAAFRSSRHQRRMDLLGAPLRLAKATAVSVVLTTSALLLLGIILALAEHRISEVIAPIMAVVELVHSLVVIATVVWGPAVMAAPWVALAGLWKIGQSKGTVPAWVLPERERAGEAITPSIVVTAMRDLGIGKMRSAIKDMADGAAGMLGPIKNAGCGVEVDVLLPSGVSTEEVQNRRRKLAENLTRHEHELFITIPQAARTVRLWIADPGALDEPIGASPLVTDPQLSADYYDGRAPWGQDLRGDLAALSLFQMHVLVTGLSNQGKTASLRALALWLALDPFVEFRIADLKGVGDWRMFLDLATVLIQGPTDAHVMQATHMVEEGVAEMERRIALVEQSGSTKGITRDMAHADLRFRPLVLIIDEAQVAYGSGAIGDDKRPYGGTKVTSRYFQAIKKIHDQGRAVNVTTWEGTQDPTNENLPKRSREGNHIRASLALGTEAQAKMALGDAPIDGGAAPHKLRQGLDKGTLVVAGSGMKLQPGQTSITIRTHFIDGDDAAQVADRAKERRAKVATRSEVEEGEHVDPLADIAAVLGAELRVRTQVVLQRLTELNRGEYEEWTFADLTAFLDDAGAPTRKSEGVMVVDRSRVLEALAARSREDAEEPDQPDW